MDGGAGLREADGESAAAVGPPGAARPLERADQATAPWLSGALRDAGLLPSGRVERLEVAHWRGKPYSDLYRLRPTYAGGGDAAPASLILKLGRVAERGETPRRRRWKEHRFYTMVAPAMVGAPVPRAYAAAFDPERGAAHLLLEDLSESHLPLRRPLPPTPAQAEGAVVALARLHAAWWDTPVVRAAVGGRDGDWIAEREAAAGRQVARFVGEVGERLAAETRRALGEVAAGYGALLRARAAGPATVVHGDAHAWNFLYPRDGADGRTILLDWEGWSIDPGVDDLAALIAMRWYPDLRRERERPLLARYHAELLACGVTGYPWDDCWDDYRRAVAKRLLAPLAQRRRPGASDAWWHNLNCLAMAYRELGCGDVLRG